MNRNHRFQLGVLCTVLFAVISLSNIIVCNGQNARSEPVKLSEDATTYLLSNGIVAARVSKQSGDLTSLVFKGHELLGAGSGHAFAYWSHAPGKGSQVVDTVTIDPGKSNGDRAEVSVKGIFQGVPLGQGPGGTTAADIEIRYALGRGDSGVYTYTILTHKAGYPATSVGEARFGAKLNTQVFDHMTIDARRNKLMPKPDDWDKGALLNMKEARRLTTGVYSGQVEHKYDYSAVQFDIPAFGWSSTKYNIGLWFVNPSMEYLSGGPTKLELTGHLDNNEGAAPTLLNYWRGSHYGGSSLVLDEGEEWSKVVGPFLIYCNEAASPDAMWHDALNKAKAESKAWPYTWVAGVDYPLAAQRGTVHGKITLDDPQSATKTAQNLLVGLSVPDYSVRGFRGGTEQVDWQNDAKHYEFWVRADADGRFNIPGVRPGKYTLHAIATNVLGEMTVTDVNITPGANLDVGKLDWKPVRYGRQLWEIGVPDRTAGEFHDGDHYNQWGLYNTYPKEFPNDVNFIIGKSDYHRDWNLMQVPRGNDDSGNSKGPATTWSITFNMEKPVTGKATLRIAFAGTEARSLTVALNDQTVGVVTNLPNTSVIHRDSDRGYWRERDVSFDASILKQGTNVFKLTVPAGNVTSGIEYDYLRLELDETAK